MRVSLYAYRLSVLAGCLALLSPWGASWSFGSEPDPAGYWDVKDVRTGMKGKGQTVMVGTRLDEFDAEVLGVMRDVSPGRDMILCRLSGCNLEHAGIIQGMSGSPIYVEGKLLGAVAYAWEFAKDPIAGVTPFAQMVEFVRANDKRVAAEAADEEQKRVVARTVSVSLPPLIWERSGRGQGFEDGRVELPLPASSLRGELNGAGGGGMVRITTPMAASGFSRDALGMLTRELGPLGMAPMATGGVLEEIMAKEGAKPLSPGSPLCISLVSGDMDLSSIGTVTHVEGDRVYGFGHPMFSLGACEFPMMNGFIHTVYPRASVSMKMGSPLKVVGVLDSDVSTGISGRIGPVPDLMPMTVKVRTGRFAEERTFRVKIARHPKMMSNFVMAVLASAIDTEGDLPEDLTARLKAKVTLKDHPAIEFEDLVSGPRYTGPLGASLIFGPVAAITSILSRNAIEPVRIEGIECEIEIDAGRKTADVESIRLASARVAPGEILRIRADLKPFQGQTQQVELAMELPADLPEGKYEVVVCDSSQSLRRRSTNEPQLSKPEDLDGLLKYLALQAELRRSTLFAHVERPESGLAFEGQAMPNLPSSVKAVLSNGRQTKQAAVKSDLILARDTEWVLEGSQTLKFEVSREGASELGVGVE